MKSELIKRIKDWSQKKAEDFHDHKFSEIGEDSKYIWERTVGGIFLWKDINALFFSDTGTVYKLSYWSNKDHWHSFVKIYENKPEFIRMDIPIFYEDINELNMGYSIIQRPGYQQGKSFIELIFEDQITTEFMIDIIENYVKFCGYLKKVNNDYNIKFPFPPKVFLDQEGIFWTDFKYWKYTEKDFVQIFFTGLERYLDVLIDMYHVDIDKNIIQKTLNKYG
jgi:hypothetical protein